jgi:AcrR family transcriptional regulator
MTTEALTPAAQATRAAILEAAERLFRTLGYQKTTVADIARELRMSPANVYRFFASKSAINEAICARTLTVIGEGVWAIARGPGTPAERIRALFAYMQQQIQELFFHERRMHDMVAAALEENWPAIDEYIRTIDTALRHIIMDGQSTGDFARVDPDQTAHLVHLTMLAFEHPMMVEECGDKIGELPALAAAMAEFCLRALRP